MSTSLALEVRNRLMAMQDAGYRDFIRRLIPTLEAERFIGVRTPRLRALAKEDFLVSRRDDFLDLLPHGCFEENQLHALLLGELKDYDEALARLRQFLPQVDNWATCDTLAVPALLQRPDAFCAAIRGWIGEEHPYTVRFGVVSLMRSFLHDHFEPGMLPLVAGIPCSHYYVRMAVAWYFSEALVAHYDLALPLLAGGTLDRSTHNKAIQKAVESYRLDARWKEELKRLRRRQR